MSTHQPFSNFEPPVPKWPRWMRWAIGYVVVSLLLSLYSLAAYLDGASDHAATDQAVPSVELAAALEAQRLQLIDEIGGSVRDAYKQGWSEALASVDSSDRGEAFAHACRRLWQGQQP